MHNALHTFGKGLTRLTHSIAAALLAVATALVFWQS